MKRHFLILLFMISMTVSAVGKETLKIRYLFRGPYADTQNYAIYENDEKISGLESLRDRKILKIRFDKKEPDNLLLAEKNEKGYSVRKFNFLTKEEIELFNVEKEIQKFNAFTETAFYWCEKSGEKKDILYEYNPLTGESRKIFSVEEIPDFQGKEYAPCISRVMANDEFIFLVCYSTLGDHSGSFLIDRKTGEAKRISRSCVKYSEGRMYTWLENPFSDGRKIKSYAFDFSDFCTIMDLETLEKRKCSFKKRCEGQGGPLVLLSEDYILVPLAIRPFIDSIRNGLFKSIWTVQYTVFDIKKNKAVFGGHISRTNEKYILDAILLDKLE